MAKVAEAWFDRAVNPKQSAAMLLSTALNTGWFSVHELQTVIRAGWKTTMRCRDVASGCLDILPR
jgi:hypothetical protein